MKKTPHIQQRRFCLQKFILFFCVITAADPSHSLIMTPCRPLSFSTFSWQLTANGSQLTADSFYLLIAFLITGTDPSLSLQDDALPASSLCVQILRLRSGWSLAISVTFAGKSKRKVMISFLNPIYNFTRIGEHKESISLCFFWRDKGRWLVSSEKETWLPPFSYSQVKTRDRIIITG